MWDALIKKRNCTTDQEPGMDPRVESSSRTDRRTAASSRPKIFRSHPTAGHDHDMAARVSLVCPLLSTGFLEMRDNLLF